MRRLLLEICIESVEDAQAAAGADRLELCQALAVGGLTPSAGLQQEIRKITSLPIMTMIRPRPGNFVYTDSEFTVMQRDIDAAIDFGSDGIVFGLLTGSATIDLDRTAQLIHYIRSSRRPLEIVFHRAFDFAPGPFQALDQLIDLGVTRILTSGQKLSALDGAPLIRELIRRAAGRIQILPGAGIRPENVLQILEQTGADQVHASLRRPLNSATDLSRSIPLGGAAVMDASTHAATSADDVRAMLAALKQ